MKIDGILQLFGVFLLALLFIAPANAQEQPDSAKQAEMMAYYIELGQPAEEHQMLAKLTGTWKQEIIYWSEPGAEPMTASAVTVNEMILGGRFLQCVAEGEAMGQKAESLLLLGFDRRNKLYTQIALDTWGTYYVTAAGEYNEDTKTITTSGEEDVKLMGFTQVYDMTVKFVSDDEYITELIFKDEFMTKGKGPYKMMEIVHRRVK